MSKPFDATLKDLGEDSPEAFVREFDGPPQLPVFTLNVDLSTVTTAADLVFGLGEPLQEILHIDCQAGAKADLAADLYAYNSLLYRRVWPASFNGSANGCSERRRPRSLVNC